MVAERHGLSFEVYIKCQQDIAILPRDDPFIAVAFSIEQTGSDGNTNICRGEDWRRSGHNATCAMHDQPFHHTRGHFVSLGLAFLEEKPSEELAVWGHDHDGAYRQLSASVWSYNRLR